VVEDLLNEYARNRDEGRAAVPSPAGGTGRVLFLGSAPLLKDAPERTALFWRWRLEDHYLEIRPTGDSRRARQIARALKAASRGSGSAATDFYRGLEQILGEPEAKAAWKILRQGGLALY
jgi:hypothetical protein